MGGDYTSGGRAGVPRVRRVHTAYLRLLLLLAGVVLVVAYLFIRPVARLADAPPREFTAPRPEWNAARRSMEERLALAYWQRATTAIQWDYLYGSELPEQPPADFKIDTSDFQGMPAAVAECRARYWRRLRRVWGLPQSWKTSYEWNTEWVTKVIDAVFH
jgi:hypothetical protein